MPCCEMLCRPCGNLFPLLSSFLLVFYLLFLFVCVFSVIHSCLPFPLSRPMTNLIYRGSCLPLFACSSSSDFSMGCRCRVFASSCFHSCPLSFLWDVAFLLLLTLTFSFLLLPPFLSSYAVFFFSPGLSPLMFETQKCPWFSFRQTPVPPRKLAFFSFFKKCLVKGVFKASRQKVNIGGTSANERGDGRACDPAYV